MSQNNEEAPFEWSVRPYKESLPRTAIVIAVILAVGVLAYLMFKAVFWSVFSQPNTCAQMYLGGVWQNIPATGSGVKPQAFCGSGFYYTIADGFRQLVAGVR